MCMTSGIFCYITSSVDQELLLRNEFLTTENRILKNQIKGRLQLTDLERISLAQIGKRLGRMALAEVAQMVRPETILGWHRKVIARKFDGSKQRTSVEGATGSAGLDQPPMCYAARPVHGSRGRKRDHLVLLC